MAIEQLVLKAKEGDDDAFLQIIGTVKIELYKTALAYLRNKEDAIEAIQEVTFRSYKGLKDLKDPSYFKTWLIRIMINYCNDTLKMQKRMVLNEDLLLTMGKSENYSLMEIQDAMQALDERSREILTLKYFHDLKIKDIAGTLDCPEGTVKTWLNKALKSLREKLEEKGGMSHV
ncbi:RNA polymerase sigma-70 factor (ECF subfamily) [Cytobacillus oceanisediminis]|uniref:RNA polymerase sigma-70 factor (ECF subfamily) n=1 Tax=Cytobacillus oceanisediminis TaxID=665099 RepID=A0A2V2ZYV2_9BACI|nr:sigma-70 family RNA polymerase sigma factor [Cytobacillus oceanisediminis]PWW29601.1 RNA polymerase sigma-70 factor (ECF subfamily) [Cytobacillus oceanisediminis]